MPVTRTRTRKKKEAETKLVPATLHVVSRVVGSDEDDKDSMYELDVRQFEVDPAYVTLKAGVTKSPQQYESVRIDVSVSTPCYVEELDDTIEAVSEIVYEALQREVEAYGVGGEEDGEED